MDYNPGNSNAPGFFHFIICGMKTFAEKVISFDSKLNIKGTLPAGIAVMNPYVAESATFETVTKFYHKYYNDCRKRHLILGINPGRYGAGVTGIPFTDTTRLKEKCGLTIPGLKTYETSSVFVYEMIDQYGGPGKFYSDFYIGAVSPLGYTIQKPGGKAVNFNYYDSKALTKAILNFIVDSLKKQISFGIETNICYCLGTGKNFRFLSELNSRYHFFHKIEPLEHPRYIMQYKAKQKHLYIKSYVDKLLVSKSG